MGYATDIQWHPDGGYSFVDQSGSYASHDYQATRQALLDSGRQRPDELLAQARKNWLYFVAVQSVDGPRFAIEQNGQWSLSSDLELFDLLIRDGIEPADAKIIMGDARTKAIDVATFCRLVVKRML